MTTTPFLLILVAAILHSLWNLAAKKASGDLSVIWIGLVIGSVVFAPLLLILTPQEIAFNEILPYLGVSGIIHAAYFVALSKVYEHGDISVVYPIARGSGIGGTAVLAYLFLQENITPTGASGVGLICAGILILGLKSTHSPKIILQALLVGFIIMVYSILDKVAVGISHPIFYLFGFFVTSMVMLAPYVLLYKRDQLSEAWKSKKKYSAIIGLGSIGTYLIVLYVMQIAPVSYVVAARELAVVFGAILGFVYLKEGFSWRKMIGVLTVVVGIILIKIA